MGQAGGPQKGVCLIARLKKWFGGRSGWKDIRTSLFDRKIPSPGRWGWLYTLGSATLAVLILQVVTGTFLAMSYSPSPDHAYESIRYIMTQVPFGNFIRGLHHWGASGMIVLLLLHMARVFMMGSYKGPRELTWIAGVLLLLGVFGLGFTGYLLPWDQKAYWATAVGTNIAAQAPFLGPIIAKVLKGGEEMGAITLTRFYAFHILVLPAFVFLMLGVHLFLVIYHGISAPPPSPGKGPVEYARLKEQGKSFFPYSIFKDMMAVVIVYAILFFLAGYYGADLETPADPNDSSYNPRPEWYFLFLFQMLKLFPGHLEALAAVVVPTLLLVFLLVLPLIDRSAKRHPLGRPILMGGGLLGAGFVVWLSYQGWVSPLLNPRVEQNPMVLQGEKLYTDLKCVYCHSLRGKDGLIGPDLYYTVRTRSDEWLDRHFRDPRLVVPGSTMPVMNLMDEEIQALIAYLREIGGGGAKISLAMKVYRENCQSCHRFQNEGEEIGPDLTAAGSLRGASFIKAYIENPQWLNPDSVMPEFKSSLTEEEIENLSLFLAAQKNRK